MPDLIEKLLFVILGALLSGGAFLLKRRIEGRPTLESDYSEGRMPDHFFRLFSRFFMDLKKKRD